jgi:hypothetical protein
MKNLLKLLFAITILSIASCVSRNSLDRSVVVVNSDTYSVDVDTVFNDSGWLITTHRYKQHGVTFRYDSVVVEQFLTRTDTLHHTLIYQGKPLVLKNI